MHSSRMHTGCSLTICWHLLLGGVRYQGGVCSWGVCACSWGEIWSQRVCVCSHGWSVPGGVSGPGGVCLVLGEVWSLGVCLLPGDLVWGSAPGEEVWSQGGCVSAAGGCVCSGGCSIPACTEADTLPSPLWTESQMPVKTLPWPNFMSAPRGRSGPGGLVLGGSGPRGSCPGGWYPSMH